jgi:hypothetical protein
VAANPLRRVLWERDDTDLLKEQTTPEYRGHTGQAASQEAELLAQSKLVMVDPVTGQPPGPRLDQFPVIQIG